ncbi:hypothetical protein HDV06_002667 [Boothiomyces sp. JEL0866]|nr:hypothetical protein HDV06_002667 [Boothiomyces sp. JEL0866]
MQMPVEDAATLIYGLGLTLMQFSLFGSVYVIYRVIYKWRQDGAKPITLRFPFYIAFTDIFMYTSCMLNFVHNAIYRSDWDGVTCKIVAAANGFSAASNMILVASISVVVYCSTVLRRPLDLGKHDWKLLAFVSAFALLLEGMAYPSNGQSWYWCYENMYSTSKIVSIISLLVDSSMFMVVVVCGTFVLIEIHKVKKSKKLTAQRAKSIINSKSIHSEDPVIAPKKQMESDEVLKRSARKILTFIVNYFIQWLV